MTLKPLTKGLLIALILGGIFFGVKWYQNLPKDAQSTLVSSGETVIPDAPEASLPTNAKMLDLPSKTPSTKSGVNLTWAEMAWQSQTGLNFANGGAVTTEGSLVESTGLNINIIRQDNPTLAVTELVKNTVEYSKNPAVGGYAFTVMGSGVPMYFRMAYEGIKKEGLSDDYLPVVVLTFGKSYNEDQVIGDIKYRNNPQLLRGAVVRGVRLDGDLDMAIKLASDNNVPLNTDGHTYDKNALNFIYSDDFLSCVNDYNQYTKFSLKVAENGKTTSRDTMVTADLVATWTPGDVRVAEGPEANSATIVSTKTYASIMPNITIMSRKFVNDNRDKMVKLTAVLATAGDQIKSYTQIRKYACGLNAAIWNEQNAEYWYQYFTPQKRGELTLGGSMVFNLSDMNNMFGMNGKAFVYKSIYNTFAKLQSKLYPQDFEKNEMFPQGYVPFEQVVDNSILFEANQKYTDLQQTKEFKADYSGQMTTVVSDKEIHIQFETGSATIPQTSIDELDELAESLIATQGLKIKVEGHTDNVGNPNKNKDLSQRRADAAVQHLLSKGVELERITSEGFGDEKPKATNETTQGRAINRRVEIIQGN